MNEEPLRKWQLRRANTEVRLSGFMLLVFPLIAAGPWVFPESLSDPAIVRRVAITLVALGGEFLMLVWLRLAQVSRDYWRRG